MCDHLLTVQFDKIMATKRARWLWLSET